MSRRPLTDAEAALWKRVIATVEPFKDRAVPTASKALPIDGGGLGGGDRASRTDAGATLTPTAAIRPQAARSRVSPIKGEDWLSSGATKPTPGWTFTPAPVPTVKGNLDGHWDRRMAKGGVQPDVTIDLHGHTLASAYARLDLALGQAIAADMRLMLLITGKARAPETGRGAIRAAVSDWLASSRHAGDIAAVRNAHPRHGGDGALYIVLRRKRG
ncbi:DNA-nicking Smr family endonuclease [Blastomonas natatoria]|uniref:DNA-nicking Smr family endonuclease n=1 Tax=Blastomonas natatoria TaxID=34015 RepID=A0A2V3UPH8_9SPHN|nr:Smr/MutS family protein [Blastomonas natatoria]PXW67611.1 DNA-nicking Smr family endonuclease [Blastomonas natatoria]